jgi:hypothetical protein
MTFPESSKLFERFAIDAGTDGAARANFQLLVTDLVMVVHPDATTVEGAGGRDWGIDTVAGELAGGEVRLWQSKFVLSWQNKNPRTQVYASYNSAKKKAGQHGYKLKTWTLVVPCILAPEELKWFQTWAKGRLKADDVAVSLWDGPQLRHKLQSTDAEHIARHYFPHLFPMPTGLPQAKKAEVAHLADPAAYADALFVRQLREAGRTETDAASANFFATDALVRDLAEKGEAEAVAAMRDLELEVRTIWESEFSKKAPHADADGRISDLIDEVIDRAGSCDDPDGLALNKAHKRGTAHRIVEHRWAGWVTHWRDVADDHDLASFAWTMQTGEPITSAKASPAPVAAQSAPTSSGHTS